MSRKPPHYCRTADRSVPARFTQSCLSERVVPFKSQQTSQGILDQSKYKLYETKLWLLWLSSLPPIAAT